MTSPPSDHEARRLARRLVRGAQDYGMYAESWDFDWRMEPWGKWSVGLVILYASPSDSMCPHVWLLGAVARLGAKAAELEPVLRALRAPPELAPLVAADQTPPGEALFFVWVPREAHLRHAPEFPGRPCNSATLSFLTARLAAHHAQLLERQEAQRKGAWVAPIDDYDPEAFDNEVPLYTPPPMPSGAHGPFFAAVQAPTSRSGAAPASTPAPASSGGGRPSMMMLTLLGALAAGAEPEER